jgi:hypothetical protein
MTTQSQALQQMKEALQAYVDYAEGKETDEWFKLNNNAIRALAALAAVSSEAPDRIELQAKGKHPAPCARHCEANAFNIEIRQLKAQLAASASPAREAPPVAQLQTLLEEAKRVAHNTIHDAIEPINLCELVKASVREALDEIDLTEFASPDVRPSYTLEGDEQEWQRHEAWACKYKLDDSKEVIITDKREADRRKRLPNTWEVRDLHDTPAAPPDQPALDRIEYDPSGKLVSADVIVGGERVTMTRQPAPSVPVGEVIDDHPVHGWHMRALVAWEQIGAGAKLYAAPVQAAPVVPDVDWLSNVIRMVDGEHKLGAGALAEKIVEAIAAAPSAPAQEKKQ